MESQRFLQKITEFARAVVHKRADQQEKFSIAQAGVICCRHRQQIREVPFLQPCLVLVLAGQKILYHGDREIRCDRGNYFAIPAPAEFNMINVPDERRQEYLALCISFDAGLIDRFRQLYNHGADGLENPNSLVGPGNALLYSTLLHFLEVADLPTADAEMIEHRLLEILLCLTRHCRNPHMLLSMSGSWRERLSSLFMTDPARSWRVPEVCRLLAVGESTLGRNLRKEDTSFQGVLDDVRLGQALAQIQFTDWSISRIAGNCGYQSVSSFTERFRHRFQVTPSGLRKKGPDPDEN